MLGFLQRNLRVNSRETKASAYFTLVRPNLEYCSNVWSPYTIQAKERIEMVQRRAARYATNRYRNTSSVTDMLEDLNWDTLDFVCFVALRPKSTAVVIAGRSVT